MLAQTRTFTLAELETLMGIQVLEYLDRDVDVPTLSGMQAQGDVLVQPIAPHRPGLTSRKVVNVAEATKAGDGVAVVRGENGGNTHALVANIHSGPNVTWAANPGTSALDLVLGTLTVPAGEAAFLAHPEHGYLGIGEGVYTLKRSREMAQEIRLIAD